MVAEAIGSIQEMIDLSRGQGGHDRSGRLIRDVLKNGLCLENQDYAIGFCKEVMVDNVARHSR